MPVDFWLARRFGRSGARKWTPPKRRRKEPFVPWWWLWLTSGMVAGGLLRDFVWRLVEVLR